ncbi:hypothetical protein ACFQU7_28515 [Pseudoroseomonas wenyumeiae]
MARLDRRGLSLSTASDVAAERYREGVDLLLSAWPGAAEALDEAVAADPDFALAHAARARLHAIRAEPAQARARIAAAAEAAARSGTDRERSHVEVLSLVIHGQPARALERALAHAETWPRDVLVLSLPLGAFGLFAFSGMADHDQARVDLASATRGTSGRMTGGSSPTGAGPMPRTARPGLAGTSRSAPSTCGAPMRTRSMPSRMPCSRAALARMRTG